MIVFVCACMHSMCLDVGDRGDRGEDGRHGTPGVQVSISINFLCSLFFFKPKKKAAGAMFVVLFLQHFFSANIFKKKK